MTEQQFIDLCGKSKVRLVPYLNDCMIKYAINTNLRIQHFLAQVMHESMCFMYFKEIASGSAYEGRKYLGNDFPGDGVKFKGRGVIQITGRNNYTLIANELNIDCVNHPELLESDKYGILTAGWFWNRKNLNNFADKDDLISITKRINGGLNGLNDRQLQLNKCKKIIV